MSDESIFINRELSWLDFNRRVLALGKDKNVPLGERIKFLAIYGSNLDEFFMVRVGSLQERANLEQSKTKKEKRENKTNMTAAEQLAAIMPKTAQMQEECDKFYAKALENLAENGYHKVDFDHLTKEEEHLWKKYFQSELFPILSPQIVDNRHPFPFLRNKEIYLGVLLKEKHTQEQSLGIVPISSQMERMHFIKKDGAVQFALTEELVLHYASSIFGKDSIQEKCLFRVTRNADIDVKEGMMDHDIDYREIMTELLRRRRKLAAVRLQITPAPAPEVERLLCSRLELTRKRVFLQKSPLDLSFFFKLSGRMETEGHPALFYTPARPMLPPPDYDLAAEVQKHDVLLSYPYQSIRPFIAMLKKAAQDPDVISIKMTLYRMARESQIVQALMEAAENGKEVVALVELRARFDEQNNIDWSKQLESAGCTVIYGFEDYKVHSKLTLITKKGPQGYSYITQIGTGNYNEKTSELYTDYSFITADLGIGEEASNVFQNLAVQQLTETSDKMLVAPLRFKSVLLEEMDHVISAARMGRPAREADIKFAGGQKSAHAGDQIAAVRGSQTDMHGQEMPRPRHMGDHGSRTAHAFLGRLEQQTHTPPQGGRVRRRQQGRQPKAQSHMPVMGTGMAQAFMPGDEALAHGPVGSLLRFHQRQGVHVAAQHQRQRRVRRAHIGHQARGPAHALQPVRLPPAHHSISRQVRDGLNGGRDDCYGSCHFSPLLCASARCRARASTSGAGRPMRAAGSMTSCPTRGARPMSASCRATKPVVQNSVQPSSGCRCSSRRHWMIFSAVSIVTA